MFLTHLAVAAAFLAGLFSAAPLQTEETCPQAPLDWRESRSSVFAVISLPGDQNLNERIFNEFTIALDESFAQFDRFFQATPPEPISLRLYPTEHLYHCLNALASPLAPGATHSHIGTREIALIVENISPNYEAWKANALNELRYELAILFVNHLTNSKAPPGLAVGMGVYAENPEETFEVRLAASGLSVSRPSGNWLSLWAYPAEQDNPGRALQNASIVAFLLEVYGWSDFLDLLAAFPTSSSFQDAVESTYGKSLQVLENRWVEYYPYYMQGRWRANAIYGYDLSIFETLIAEGAYTDAVTGLLTAIEFLNTIENTDLAAQASVLLQDAQIGVEANTQALEARQALLQGQFSRTLELIVEAEKKFTYLGNSSMITTLDSYREQAEEAFDLREQLAVFEALPSARDVEKQLDEIYTLGNRMSETGDKIGVDRINALIQDVSRIQATRSRIIAALCILATIGILAHRLTLARQDHPVEVGLQ